jgi:YjgF/chorismate_mutase-like, putative endoribonuclease
VAVDAERRVRELGLEIQDYAAKPYAGTRYAASMKPHHRSGNLLLLGGHVPERADGTLLHPGKLGAEVSVEQGIEAARLMACNCLAGIRHAVGSLDRVKHLVRSLNFVAAAADFYDIYLVANGATDLFRDVFGDEAGIGARATIGVTVLSRNACVENWLTLEVED